MLLQHRVSWSHFGGTWGLPGGARQPDESELEAAFREAAEETGVETRALAPRFAVRLSLPPWSYTTVAADAPARLPVSVTDAESTELAWTAADDVAALPLHPGLADAWPRLRALLPARPALVVDAANVVGSRPDGWWRDRRSAAGRLLELLGGLAEAGVPVEPDDDPLPVVRRWPAIVAVLEGQARGAVAPAGVRVVDAPADGDATIVALLAGSPGATVVTADRALAERCRAAGATVRGPSWLLALGG